MKVLLKAQLIELPDHIGRVLCEKGLPPLEMEVRGTGQVIPLEFERVKSPPTEEEAPGQGRLICPAPC